MKKRPILGAFVSFNEREQYLIGAAKFAINIGANAFMFFNGSPHTFKKPQINPDKVQEFQNFWLQHNFDLANIVVHAPYIINIANVVDAKTWSFGVEALRREIAAARALKITTLVLHPGSYTKSTPQRGLQQVIRALNLVLDDYTPDNAVYIALETMSGKGSEVGWNFPELQHIIENVQKSEFLGVCLDTCHLYSAGYDLNNWQKIKTEIAQTFGLHKVWVIHLNDSKTPFGSKKDRHENIGMGTIGLNPLKKIVWDADFQTVPKILETPWSNAGQPLYQSEISNLLDLDI